MSEMSITTAKEKENMSSPNTKQLSKQPQLSKESDSRPETQSRTNSKPDSRHESFHERKGAVPRKYRDDLLRNVDDDPRTDEKVGEKAAKVKGGGRNTESFDPKSTLVRPEMRIIVGPSQPILGRKIKHDDVVIVPEFFCKESDWSIYYKLVEEMRESQAAGLKKSEWVSWHEGTHLISHNPTGSKLFADIQRRISQYFGINNHAVGTRFNWYRDSSDWKPFHHDSAAFNPTRAKNQNITVGVSFGATRELAFLHARDGSRIYFPQTNGMMFSFGRDVNIKWKHGVNALSEAEQSQDGRGRISIILWGLCPDVLEESGAPPMLTDNTRGFGHSIHAPNAAGRNGAGSRKSGRNDGRDRRDPSDRDGHRDRGSSRDHPHQQDCDSRHDRDGRSHARSRSRSRDYHPQHQHQRRDSRDYEYRDDRRDYQAIASGEGRESAMSGRYQCRDFQKGRCRFGDRCRFVHT